MDQVKFSILFLLFVSLISCGEKKQASQIGQQKKQASQITNQDSIPKTSDGNSIAEADSAILLHKIIKSVTDTLPEFLHAKLSPGTDADSANNYCGLNVYSGGGITTFYLNDTLNGIEVSY